MCPHKDFYFWFIFLSSPQYTRLHYNTQQIFFSFEATHPTCDNDVTFIYVILSLRLRIYWTIFIKMQLLKRVFVTFLNNFSLLTFLLRNFIFLIHFSYNQIIILSPLWRYLLIIWLSNRQRKSKFTRFICKRWTFLVAGRKRENEILLPICQKLEHKNMIWILGFEP